MTATAAEALELALWLYRVPARRTALLGRPLPDGIGQLLRVAGGAHDHVTAAATIAGEDGATVLEAVRFYLQQILFHEDADAYRTLGLRPDASQAQAREHHRLLQYWLHPDRQGQDEWESVYAARINQAWSHLRTPQARAAYDIMLVANGASRTFADSTSGGGGAHGGDFRIPAHRSVASPVPRVSRNRSRNLALLVLLGCVGLLILIVQRQDEPPQWRDKERAATAEVPATTAADVHERMLASLDGALMREALVREAEIDPVSKPTTYAVEQPVVRVTRGDTRERPLPTQLASTVPPNAAPMASQASAARVSATHPGNLPVASPRTPTSRTAAEKSTSASKPIKPIAQVKSAPERVSHQPRSVPVIAKASLPPAKPATKVATRPPLAVIVPDASRPDADRVPAPITSPVATLVSVADPVAMPPPLAAPATAELAPPTPVAVAAALSTASYDPYGRMIKARKRADQVVAYLRDRNARPPPVWNDLDTMRQAQRIRDALHGRHGGRRSVRLELQAPKWRVSADGAQLAARYRVANEQGRLGLDFTWREEQLLVRAISLVPDA